MDVEELKQDWQHRAAVERHAALDADTVSRWIEGRARTVTRDVRRRLRREMAAYIPMPLIICAIALVQGAGATRLAVIVVVSFAIGGIVATLGYAERRIQAIAVDRSVRDVIDELLLSVTAASRAYELAYVAFFACMMLLLALTTWWRSGFGIWFKLAILAGTLGVLWARASGRAYVDRMFGRYRSELSDCLRDLDGRAS